MDVIPDGGLSFAQIASRGPAVARGILIEHDAEPGEGRHGSNGTPPRRAANSRTPRRAANVVATTREPFLAVTRGRLAHVRLLGRGSPRSWHGSNLFVLLRGPAARHRWSYGGGVIHDPLFRGSDAGGLPSFARVAADGPCSAQASHGAAGRIRGGQRQGCGKRQDPFFASAGLLVVFVGALAGVAGVVLSALTVAPAMPCMFRVLAAVHGVGGRRVSSPVFTLWLGKRGRRRFRHARGVWPRCVLRSACSGCPSLPWCPPALWAKTVLAGGASRCCSWMVPPRVRWWQAAVSAVVTRPAATLRHDGMRGADDGSVHATGRIVRSAVLLFVRSSSSCGPSMWP